MKLLAITKKDILMYYLKGPVIIFDILPFLFLAFWIGRQLELNFHIASLISMTTFFSTTSVSPVIASWEGQMRTLERLLAYPVYVTTIVSWRYCGLIYLRHFRIYCANHFRVNAGSAD